MQPYIRSDFLTVTVDRGQSFKIKRTKEKVLIILEIDDDTPLNVLLVVGRYIWSEEDPVSKYDISRHRITKIAVPVGPLSARIITLLRIGRMFCEEDTVVGARRTIVWIK